MIKPKSADDFLKEVSQAVVASGISSTAENPGETTLEALHSRVITLEVKLGQIIRRYFRGEDFSEPSA